MEMLRYIILMLAMAVITNTAIGFVAVPQGKIVDKDKSVLFSLRNNTDKKDYVEIVILPISPDKGSLKTTDILIKKYDDVSNSKKQDMTRDFAKVWPKSLRVKLNPKQSKTVKVRFNELSKPTMGRIIFKSVLPVGKSNKKGVSVTYLTAISGQVGRTGGHKPIVVTYQSKNKYEFTNKSSGTLGVQISCVNESGEIIKRIDLWMSANDQVSKRFGADYHNCNVGKIQSIAGKKETLWQL